MATSSRDWKVSKEVGSLWAWLSEVGLEGRFSEENLGSSSVEMLRPRPSSQERRRGCGKEEVTSEDTSGGRHKSARVLPLRKEQVLHVAAVM